MASEACPVCCLILNVETPAWVALSRSRRAGYAGMVPPHASKWRRSPRSARLVAGAIPACTYASASARSASVQAPARVASVLGSEHPLLPPSPTAAGGEDKDRTLVRPRMLRSDVDRPRNRRASPARCQAHQVAGLSLNSAPRSTRCALLSTSKPAEGLGSHACERRKRRVFFR